ncbi:MAG: T9SS type B sorting domain-containing protein [Xanthomarina gelatinilytica]|uniref:T9SS type B sorting domain-containing protein n=1 Tax=Xanthomarina gelatinilytica TaxID=1137281 RepID=UPI003A83724A
MKKVLFYSIFLCIFSGFGQRQADNWIFGQNAGINFSTGNPINISGNNIQMNTVEGCASISDSAGNLLFYVGASSPFADRLTVWIPHDNNGDGLDDVMQNGNNLTGNVSATQSTIIVPNPDDSNIYYIFTTEKYSNTANSPLTFYTVDMLLNNGQGSVINNGFELLSNAAEKLTAVRSADCSSIWVIAYSSSNGVSQQYNTFHSYEISGTGVNTNSITSPASINPISDGRGYLKVSPQGDKLAIAHTGNNSAYIYDFDNETGTVINGTVTSLNFPNSNNTYGVEFSAEGKRLYISTYNVSGQDTNPNSIKNSFLYQFDLESTNPENTAVLINSITQTGYRNAMQLALNGKIYISEPRFWGFDQGTQQNGGANYLSAINNPENLGLACNYESNVISLGVGFAHQGLPPFISSFFINKMDIINNPTPPIATNYLPLCLGETYTLMAEDIPEAIYTWTFNGNPLPNTDYFLDVNQNGSYEVLIDLNNGGCDFLEGEAIVEYFPIPMANPIPDFELCDDNDDEILNFDLTTQNTSILGNQDSNIYSTHYFESLSDANSNQNEITEIYTNQTNPQEVFARVDLTGSPSCYSITSFFLVVNPLPKLEDETVYYCLNTFPQTIPLSAGIVNDSPANYTYLWSTGETTETIQINQIGDYTVKATNIHGCTMSKTVTVEPSNIATFEEIIIIDVTEHNTVTVIVSGEGDYEYALNNQDGLYATFQSSNTFTNVHGGIYKITVRDIKNNCGIVTQVISVIDFPEFFTPNGDGHNDTWNVKGVSNVFQPNTMIRIFDRYGKLVKQIDPLGKGWDGTFNGEPLPTSDYWFSATLQDGREFKSHFTLKR